MSVCMELRQICHCPLVLPARMHAASPLPCLTVRGGISTSWVAICALLTQACCQARWAELHPGEKMRAAYTLWTEEQEELLKITREGRPRATWADIVRSNPTLDCIGVVSDSSTSQQADALAYDRVHLLILIIFC